MMRARITLKAFANSNPGLRFSNPGITNALRDLRNSEGVANGPRYEWLPQPFSGLRLNKNYTGVPRAAKAQPWADISQRFQRYFDFGGMSDFLFKAGEIGQP